MHKLAEKIADCLKAKVEGMGIDNIEGATLEELGKWVDIIKDIACYDKDMRIIKAMDEAEENEEKMKYIEEYEDYPEMEMRRGYRGQPRSKTSGRFMSRGDGRRSNRGRRGYEEPWDEMYDEMEYMRDMDRGGMNRMYYSGSGSNSGMSGQSSSGSGMSGGSSGGNMGGTSGGSSGGSRGYSEGSRYENARRGYEEKKQSGADKQEKMKSLEEYMKELGSDLSSLLSEMSPEEKTMVKSKLSMLAQKVS